MKLWIIELCIINNCHRLLMHGLLTLFLARSPVYNPARTFLASTSSLAESKGWKMGRFGLSISGCLSLLFLIGCGAPGENQSSESKPRPLVQDLDIQVPDDTAEKN